MKGLKVFYGLMTAATIVFCLIGMIGYDVTWFILAGLAVLAMIIMTAQYITSKLEYKTSTTMNPTNKNQPTGAKKGANHDRP